MRKTRLGQELIAGLEEALEHEKGAKMLRTSELEISEPARPWKKEEISQLRKQRFGVSQPVFAALLSVTASTVRAWEQGQKSPSGAARRLLEVAAMAPDFFVRLSKATLAGSKSDYPLWATHSQVADLPFTMKNVSRRSKKAVKFKPK